MGHTFPGRADWSLRVRLSVGFGIMLAAAAARICLLPAGGGLPTAMFYPLTLTCILTCAIVPGIAGAALGALAAFLLFTTSAATVLPLSKAVASTAFFLSVALAASLGARSLVLARGRIDNLVKGRNFVSDSGLIGIVELRGRHFARVNAGFERMLGWQRGELAGRSTRVAHPDDASYQAMGASIQAARRGASFVRMEYRLVRKDGRPVWVDMHGAWESPDADQSLWVLADITARKANEEALRQSQSFLARTGAVARVGGWQYQLGADRLDWSDETCRLHGVEPGHRPTLQEAVGYYAPQARPLIQRAMDAAIAAGTPFDVEVPVVSAAGRRFWARVVGEPELEDGVAVRLVGAFQDVTRRRAMEQDLAKTHELTRVTLESIGDAVITTDRQWNVAWMNPVAERLTGWDRQAAQGQSLDTIFAVTDASTDGLDPIGGLPGEATLIARDGTRSGIEASASPIVDGAGADLGTVVVFRDVSEQRRLNRAIRQRERQYAEALNRLDVLFRHSADSMMVARRDTDGRFVYEAVNPVWERLSDVTAAAAIGRTPHDCLEPALAATIAAGWEACVRERRTVSFDFQTPGGGGRECESLAAPVIGGDGEIDRLIAVARDVTERNRFEAGMRQVQRMEAVGQLTAGIAHDFNNLLQAVLGALELLLENPSLDAEAREAAAMADGAAKRGATVVHRLLAFSRKQSLDPVVLRPETVLQELGVLLGSALGSGVRVETKIAPGAWPLRADGGQLANCLLNLALNARDAMPDGGVLELRVDNAGVGAARGEGLPAGDYVRFTVRDTGTGMTPETLARALEPFFTTKPIGKGTGLGLSMVQGFARQSGGDVRIASAPGAGTSVSLWLPRGKDAPASPPVAAPAPARAAPQRPCVLIADDQNSVCRMLSLVLTRAGLDPVTCETGEQALDYLRAGGPCDLLVSDQSMPGMTGTALIDRATRMRPSLPAMLITGHDMSGGPDWPGGRVAVLRKPFRQAAFLEQVEALLTGHAAVAPGIVASNVIPLRAVGRDAAG